VVIVGCIVRVGNTPFLVLPTKMRCPAVGTDDALFGVAPLTHVMPVIVRFLDHASCTSVIPLDPVRHRRLLAVQPACRIAPICSWSTKLQAALATNVL